MSLRIAFSLFALLYTYSGFAQTVLLHEDVNNDTIKSDFGPNLKRFNHFYMGYGLVLGPSTGAGADILFGKSSNFTFGYRVKRKLSNTLAVGWELNYNTTSFRLKQDSLKIFPHTLLHEKEVFFSHAFQLQLYARLNFGKRGNYVGNFIDIGGWGQWDFSYRHFYRDMPFFLGSYNAQVVEVTNKKLLYTQPLNYGLGFRAGANRFVIYAQYRLSNIFDNVLFPTYPELPRLVVGLQIVLF